MILLAVDASGETLSAALAARGKVWRAKRGPAKPHDETILPAVEGLLKRAKVAWKDIDAVAAASGPGRFTGIRVGMAFAAGIGVASGASMVAVGRLEAAAEKAGGARVLAALPGWKGEIYHRRFERGRPVGPAEWTAPEAWPKVRAEAESAGWTVALADTDAADLLPVARRLLAAKRLPPFKPFYLKPAGYEKPRG